MRKTFVSFVLGAAVCMMVGLTACDDAASVASRNTSKAADNFEVVRRIKHINGITDKILMEIEGRCSSEPMQGRVAITCMTGPNQFKKHFLGLSDNITYQIEQLEDSPASTYHYRVQYNPSLIFPDIRSAK